MGGYSIQAFRSVPSHHFLFSVLLFGCFATAYIHTKETDFQGSVRFYIFGAITGGLHLFLMVLSKTVDGQANNKKEKHKSSRTFGIYRTLLFFFMIYCIVGGAVTGIHGICPIQESEEGDGEEDGEDSCVYQENVGVNLAMAIAIVVLHALSILHSLYVFSKSKELERQLLALAKPTPAPTKTAKTAAQKSPTPPRSLGNTSQDKTETTILSPGKKAAPKSSTVAPKEGNKSQNKTTTIKPSPCRKAESTKAAPNKSMEQTGVNAKAIQAVTADITKTKNDYLPFENQEETAMRLLRIHQMEEAMRNTHGEYYTERVQVGDHCYIPAYLPPPLPSPPSYETAVSGAYPAHDPLQPVTLQPDISDMYIWTPGPELERSKEYNSNISHRSMALSQGPMPPDPYSVLARPNNVSFHSLS